jgi:mRNA interferase YafQ
MPLALRHSTSFRRDVKRLARKGADLVRLEAVIETRVVQQSLGERYRDYPLVGNRKEYRECHIQPDWLLIYRIAEDELQLVRTGSHAELFGR